MAKQMKYADAIHAQNVVILGPEELAAQKVKIKHMSTGTETWVDLHQLIHHA
jgi:histidyl-tRNA synthetase